jgi:hypothetical protein
VSRVGPALFVLLLGASVVAAGIVIQARSPDLAIQITRFPKEISPNGDRKEDVGHIRFFVRESDPDATVEIVGPNLKLIRILAKGPLVANEPVSLTWNGRTDSGALAKPRDRYRLRVLLPSQDRDMVYPRRISLSPAGRE